MARPLCRNSWPSHINLTNEVVANLVALPPQEFGSTHDQQAYADACAAAGLRPVVPGYTSWGAPDYCLSFSCMQTPYWDWSFWDYVGDAMGWVNNCIVDGDAPAPAPICAGPTLVAFTPAAAGRGAAYSSYAMASASGIRWVV
jgi:hypothetical protein